MRTYMVPLAIGVMIVVACSRPPGQREFERGLNEMRQGNYVQAQTLLEQSIHRRPGHAANAAAYNLIGVACCKLGKQDEARSAFEHCLNLDARHPEATYNLGVLRAQQNDLDGAARLFSEASKLAPADSRALEYWASLFIRRGQFGPAQSVLEQAKARNPSSPSIPVALARIHWEEGRDREAINELRHALELNDRYPPANYSLAVIHQQLRQDRDAVVYYKRFLAQAPDGSPQVAQARQALVLLDKSAPPTLPTKPAATPAAAEAPVSTAPAAAGLSEVIRRAAALAEKGKTASALDLFLQAAEQAGATGDRALQEKALRDAARLCFDSSRAHEALGQFLLDQKNPSDALKSFKQALVLKSDSITARLGVADAAIMTGEYDAALVTLKEAVRIDPKNGEAAWQLAQLYDRQLDLPPNAAKAYADFAARFPNDARAERARKRAKELAPSVALPTAPVSAEAAPLPPTIAKAPVADSVTIDKLPPASRRIAYRKAASRNAREADQARRMGQLSLQQGNQDRAIAYLTKALENDDSVPETFYYLALAHRLKGDLELAKDGFQRAITMNPKFVNARYELAVTYQQDRQREPALRLLEDVAREKPDFAQAFYLMGYLYAQGAGTGAEARRAYENFLRLAPNDPTADSVRRWLQQNR